MITEEIEYYQDYKTGLNNFLHTESLDLTVEQYMCLVDETLDIQQHIDKLKKLEKNEKINFKNQVQVA